MLGPRVAGHVVAPADLVLMASAAGQDLVVNIGQDWTPELRHGSWDRVEQGVAASLGCVEFHIKLAVPSDHECHLL